jgi:acyl-CoA thioesterase YciA
MSAANPPNPNDISPASPGDRGGPREPAIRVIMMPKDTNALGTIFGGIILSHIDLAGAVAAHTVAPGRLVTVAMEKVEFHKPVFVGDLVSFYADLTRVGNTSMTVRVEVFAERRGRSEKVKVTEATVVYVHVGDDGKPRQVARPGEES